MNRSQFGFNLVLIFLIISPCLATHSQGFEWKYGEGVQYDFRETFYRGDNETTSLIYDCIYYLIAPNYTELHDPLTGYVPARSASTYWPNGTEMQTGRLHFAVPVGNWSILSIIIESMSDENVTFSAFESNDMWGYEQEISTDISSYSYREEFSKYDGVLTKLTYESTIFSHHSLYVIERLGISPIILQLVMAIVAALSIVSVLIVYHRMNR
ncbi:MAG: hypothetical protein P1Q69_01450 [Candidatus Thorarchaeota archaeon]|nr:hypothetical protein [Candidatus Thorarchaeota archaeon]